MCPVGPENGSPGLVSVLTNPLTRDPCVEGYPCKLDRLRRLLRAEFPVDWRLGLNWRTFATNFRPHPLTGSNMFDRELSELTVSSRDWDENVEQNLESA